MFTAALRRDGSLYQVGATARNTCNYTVTLELELRGLAHDGGVLAVIKGSLKLEPKQERAYVWRLTERSTPDIVSLQVVPQVHAS